MERLKLRLQSAMQNSDDPHHSVEAVNQDSPPTAKIALFRSLFRGRPDAYPVKFQSRKTGKTGYSPACANEWVRGVCEKPKIKCTDCPHQRFRPVTDTIVTWHLQGHDDAGAPFVMGVYPMLQDETCFFVAVDFDKSTWGVDASAFLDTCRFYWAFPQHWNDHAPAMARTCGFSLTERSPRHWRGVLAPTS